MTTSRTILLAACCCIGVGPISAAEGDKLPSFDFDAFGTFGVVHSSEDQADFVRSFAVGSGAGATDSWSTTIDTLIGGQVTATVTPRLSAVLQLVAQYNYDNTFRPHVEWANIKFQVTPDVSLRLGRTALPIYLFADSRKIDYALPWVRPPPELYNLIPITTNDGVDGTWHARLGRATNTLQIAYGHSAFKQAQDGGVIVETRARNQFYVANTLEMGNLTLRGNVGKVDLTLAALDNLFDAFRLFGAQGTALAERYRVKDSPARSVGVAVSYDPGKWYGIGEWSRTSTDNALGKRHSWYVSGGARFTNLWRFGTLTPFVTYATVAPDSPTTAPGLDLSLVPPPLAGLASQLNNGLNGVLAYGPNHFTQSIGARWDFSRDFALTLQLDRLDLADGSHSALVNIQPGFRPGGSLTLFSAAISFVL